jgi:zinc and cadmium transporter
MLTWALMASLACGLGSLLLAAALAFRLSPTGLGRLIAFAAGTMLAAALLDILPEALASAPSHADALLATVLAGLIGFYLLERAALWRHDHSGSTPGGHGHAHALPGAPWVILLGDGVHNFVDGVLLAAAFLTDPRLGVTTAIAIALHEVPQELGDFVLLLEAGWSKRRALLANAASSLTSVAGTLVGWFALEGARFALPYALAVAAASFLYIAMADLVPLLHRRHRQDGFAAQTALLAAGLVCIPLFGHWLH